MPALTGSATFRRLFVGGTPDKGFLAKASRAVNTRRFSPTTESETLSFGWVPMTDPLADKLTQEDMFVGDLVCLGFRQDERVVRGADIRDELKFRSRELQLQQGRRLTRAEKAALKEAIVAELRARAPVRRRVAELVWNPERAEARLFGASKQMAQACGELFEKTFTLSLEEVEVEGLMKKLGWTAARPAPSSPPPGAKAPKPDREEEEDAPF
jgi:DNA recombination-dependent growth factor C